MTDFTKDELRAVKWEPSSGDDFYADAGGYKLRVEQLDDEVWWWCVYGPDGEALNEFMYCTPAPDEDRAKWLAETAYRAEAAEAALEREKRARDEDIRVLQVADDRLWAQHGGTYPLYGEPAPGVRRHMDEIKACLTAHKEDRK